MAVLRLMKAVREYLVLVLAICFTLVALIPVASAKEPATPEISLNQAISLALDQSESVQKAAKDIDRTQALRDYASDNVKFIPASSGSINNPITEITWNSFLTADLGWQASKESLTASQDGLALDTCNKYWNVLNAQQQLQTAQAAQKSAELQLRKAQASYQVGLLAQGDLLAAQAGSDGAQAQLAKAQNDLNTAYIAFNQQIGLWPEDRPVLTDAVTYEPLKIDDLDHEVNVVLESAPLVLEADQLVALKQYQENITLQAGSLPGASNVYKPYEARQIEVQQAQLDASSTRKALELLTRNLYYNVESLEQAYAGAQASAKAADESLRVTKIKFDVGLVTASEVAAAEKVEAAAQAVLVNYAAQHAYLKLAFAKPWAYLSASQQNASSSSSKSASGQ
ncbi:MAG: TolC family protein [Thermacetogeniaceae bacterium]